MTQAAVLRWPRHKKVMPCLGGRHRPRPRKSAGLCQRKRCAEWASNEVFSYGTGIVQRLCDRCLDGYLAALRACAFDPERWTVVRYFERAPAMPDPRPGRQNGWGGA